MIVSCPECGAGNRVPASRMHQRARCGRCKTSVSPLGRPLQVGSVEEFDALTREASLPVLVDFWAAWCAPCRMVAPELERLAAERAGSLIVAKVDTEALPQIAARHAIRSIPTLILFRDGAVARQVAGAMPAERIARELQL